MSMLLNASYENVPTTQTPKEKRKRNLKFLFFLNFVRPYSMKVENIRKPQNKYKNRGLIGAPVKTIHGSQRSWNRRIRDI